MRGRGYRERVGDSTCTATWAPVVMKEEGNREGVRKGVREGR